MDIRYFSGLFDGEGTVRIDRLEVPAGPKRPKPYRRFQLTMSIGMCHAPTIQALQQEFGGYITRDSCRHKRNPNHRIRYAWGVSSGYAYELLKRIEPHLIEKRAQAIIGIEFQEHMEANRTHFRKHRGNPPNYAEIVAYREKLIAEMYRLKHLLFDIPKSELSLLTCGPVDP